MSEAKKWSLESLPTPTDMEIAFPCPTVGFLPTMEELRSSRILAKWRFASDGKLDRFTRTQSQDSGSVGLVAALPLVPGERVETRIVTKCSRCRSPEPGHGAPARSVRWPEEQESDRIEARKFLALFGGKE